MYLNTKKDYLYAIKNYLDWEIEFQKLLDEEYKWINVGEIINSGTVNATHKVVRSSILGKLTLNQFEWMPDSNCRMYLLGFTRKEILDLCGWDEPGHAPKEWLPYESPKLTWDDIRIQRNLLMAACDWTQLSDAVLTFTEKTAWQNYRQVLRDIPQSFTTPDIVIWPEEL